VGLWKDVNDGSCDKDAAIVEDIIGDAVVDTASLTLNKGDDVMVYADDILLWIDGDGSTVVLWKDVNDGTCDVEMLFTDDMLL
jgi:hypothetical protein